MPKKSLVGKTFRKIKQHFKDYSCTSKEMTVLQHNTEVSVVLDEGNNESPIVTEYLLDLIKSGQVEEI